MNIDSLIAQYLDGSLSDEQMAEFVELLREDPAALDRLAESSMHELQFYDVMRQDRFRIDSLHAPAALDAMGPAEEAPPRGAFRVPPLRSIAWTALAAVLATVIAAPWIAVRWGGVPVGPGVADSLAADSEGLAQSPVVARVTQLVDVQWAQPSGARLLGSDLAVGARLQLAQGAVQITYENRARLTLEGPCDYRVEDESAGTLMAGKLAADVPEEAIGFSIRTPSSQIVDLGTLFAVEVGEQGDSTVHVFKGEVVTQQYNAPDLPDDAVLRLKRNDAVRYGAGAGPDRLTADPTGFTRDVDTRLPEDELPPLPVRSDLALWLAADRLTEIDRAGRVQYWGDLLVGDNQTAESAYQDNEYARPELLYEGLNGMPALAFDGASTVLTTSPLRTTDNQTVVFVASFVKTQPYRGQLLNYNGPPHRYVSKLSDPAVLQIDTPRQLLPNVGVLPSLKAMAFTRRNAKDPIRVGATVASLEIPDEGRPVVAAYRYDTQNNIATLWIDGLLVDQDTAPFPVGITSRKVIGCHGQNRWHFKGLLAEVLIYNAAVPDSRLSEVFSYLSERFEIPLASRP